MSCITHSNFDKWGRTYLPEFRVTRIPIFLLLYYMMEKNSSYNLLAIILNHKKAIIYTHNPILCIMQAGTYREIHHIVIQESFRKACYILVLLCSANFALPVRCPQMLLFIIRIKNKYPIEKLRLYDVHAGNVLYILQSIGSDRSRIDGHNLLTP